MLALTPPRRVYHRLRNRLAQAVSYLYFPRLIERLARQAGLRPVARRTIGFGPLSFMAAHSSASNTGCGSTTACRRLPTPTYESASARPGGRSSESCASEERSCATPSRSSSIVKRRTSSPKSPRGARADRAQQPRVDEAQQAL